MTQETFYETSVKRNPSSIQVGFSYFLIAMIFISFIIVMMAFPIAGIPVAFLFAVIFYVVHYFYKRGIYLDFDYSLTNGDLDIAKISGGEKRKHLLTVHVREGLILLAPADSTEVKAYDQKKLKTYNCTSSDEKALVYCMIAKTDSDSGEEIRLYFEPDQTMMKEFHRLSPRNVRMI